MKKLTMTGLAALLVSGFALAQIPPASTYLKLHMDSLRIMGWPPENTAVADQVIVPYDRNYNRGCFYDIIAQIPWVRTISRGKVYALPPDNMPVLAPDMTLTEKMPGSSRTYKPAPPSKMPNPLYPRRKKTD